MSIERLRGAVQRGGGLTRASTVTAAPVGLFDNENDDGAAAGEPNH
jgi:hypothetical protein